MSIKIFYDEVNFRLRGSRNVTEIFRNIITKAGKNPGNIGFIVTSDERVREINIEFLEHDYYTDVITFNYNEKDSVSGEIYISLDRVKENALNYNVSLKDELSRVMIHGILHLVGYDDNDEKSKSEMRGMENYWLDSLKQKDNGFQI